MYNKLLHMSNSLFNRFKKQKTPVIEEESSVWEDRIFWVSTLQKIAFPVLNNLAKSSLRKNMPFESNNPSSRKFAYFEAFARVFNGISSWLELGPDASEEGRIREKYINMTLKAISNSVNPNNNDYSRSNYDRCTSA